MGYHAYLRHGTSVFWNFKTRLDSGPITADLTTIVVHSYKLAINPVKLVHSLAHIKETFKGFSDVAVTQRLL